MRQRHSKSAVRSIGCVRTRSSQRAAIAAALLFLLAGCFRFGPPAQDGSAPDSNAPDGSASGTITPGGGSYQFGNVVLRVPAGAVAAPVPILVTETTEPAPFGVTLYTPVYRFEPAGLTFARPINVSIRFAGDPSRAGVYWTRAVGAGFDRLGGSVTGDWASADVSHFSLGLVGAETTDDGGMHVELPDASMLDAGPLDVPDSRDAVDVVSPDVRDAAAWDSTSPDAVRGDGGPNCPAPSYPPVFSTVTVPAAFSCFTCSNPSSGAYAAVVTLPAAMRVTMWMPHLINVPQSVVAIETDCEGGAPTCLASARYPDILTTVLSAGTYRLETCAASHGWAIEAPDPPPPANASCATAIDLNAGPYRQPRVVDSTPRYYRYSWDGSWMTRTLHFDSPQSSGHINSLSIRRDCADPTTEVYHGTVTYLIGLLERYFFTSSLPAGTYYLVASDISQGAEYTISIY